MRFRLALAGALAAAWAAAATAGAALNPQHAGLQVALRAQGLYLGPIDAIIGPKTVAAVRAFQRGHSLHVTGIADLQHAPRARAARHAALRLAHALRAASSAGTSRCCSSCSYKHGVRVPVNAYMDRPTVAGVKRYQRAMHLHGGRRCGAGDVRGARVADARAGEAACRRRRCCRATSCVRATR